MNPSFKEFFNAISVVMVALFAAAIINTYTVDVSAFLITACTAAGIALLCFLLDFAGPETHPKIGAVWMLSMVCAVIAGLLHFQFEQPVDLTTLLPRFVPVVIYCTIFTFFSHLLDGKEAEVRGSTLILVLLVWSMVQWIRNHADPDAFLFGLLAGMAWFIALRVVRFIQTKRENAK